MMRLVLLVTLAIGCGSKSAPAPASSDTACTRDDDCAAVQQGCCGCYDALTKTAAARRPRLDCEDANCPAVVRNCPAEVACRANRCVTVPVPEESP